MSSSGKRSRTAGFLRLWFCGKQEGWCVTPSLRLKVWKAGMEWERLEGTLWVPEFKCLNTKTSNVRMLELDTLIQWKGGEPWYFFGYIFLFQFSLYRVMSARIKECGSSLFSWLTKMPRVKITVPGSPFSWTPAPHTRYWGSLGDLSLLLVSLLLR